MSEKHSESTSDRYNSEMLGQIESIHGKEIITIPCAKCGKMPFEATLQPFGLVQFRCCTEDRIYWLTTSLEAAEHWNKEQGNENT